MSELDKRILRYYFVDNQSVNHIVFLLGYIHPTDYIHQVIWNYVGSLESAIKSQKKYIIEDFEVICVENQ